MSPRKEGQTYTLILCVGGLYVSFLGWSLLQERINTKPFGEPEAVNGVEFYKAPLLINTVQALFACLVGSVYSCYFSGMNPLDVYRKNDRETFKKQLTYIIVTSITSSVSSPIGYKSLKHVDYLAFLLAKSCKLIPVMLVHFILYRTRFPLYKYLVAGSVTLGVILFTFSKSGGKRSASNDGKIGLGMLQLLFSMFLDGLTNSTQDQLFKAQSTTPSKKTFKITGPILMCILNFMIFVFSLVYTFIVSYETEILYTKEFASRHPSVVYNVLGFALLGAIGQVFVFMILEQFDSIVLVTATVTRKMFSMILSVVMFNHSLNTTQWCGVLLVFGGIGFEAYIKFSTRSQAKVKSA